MEMLSWQLYMWIGVQKRALGRVCIYFFKVFGIALRKLRGKTLGEKHGLKSE